MEPTMFRLQALESGDHSQLSAPGQVPVGVLTSPGAMETGGARLPLKVERLIAFLFF